MVKNKSKAPVGASLVVLSSVFYASYGIWTKLMGSFFDGYTASALRSILVVLTLLPIAIFRNRLEPLKINQNWKSITGMFIGSLFTWGPLYYAIQNAGVGISLTVSYACMVIGLFFFGWLFSNERFTKDKAIAALLGFLGLMLIFSPKSTGFNRLALGFAIISGVSVALTMICAKKQKYNATQSTLILWITSIFANFIMAFLLKESIPKIGLHIEWVYLVLFAIASVIASWSLVSGMKLIDAGAAGILGLLEIVFGLVFGIIFFNEKLSTTIMLGASAIIIASAIPYIRDYNSKKGTL